MQLRETIKITGLKDPTAMRAMLPTAEDFKVVGRALVFDGPHVSGHFDEVKSALGVLPGGAKLYWSRRPIFDDADYAAADFIDFNVPDVEVPGAAMPRLCAGCRKPRPVARLLPLPSGVQARFGAVNGGPLVVDVEIRDQLEQELCGCRFEQADPDGRLWYLRATQALGELVFRDNEVMEPRGACGVCGHVDFEQHFGPLRFRDTGHLDGLDVVWNHFHGQVAVSARGFVLLEKLDTRVSRRSPVLIER